MKKLLIAVVISLLLVGALATVALADNGPHGKFNGSTEACASCHRAHQAKSDNGMLLAFNDTYELCTSCHDGTGAITNVVDGYYEATTDTTAHSAKSWKAGLATDQGQDGRGLFGGGFENARMLTDFGNTATQTATTNTGVNINTSITAWAVKNSYDLNQTAPTGRTVTSAHHVGQPGFSASGTMYGSGAISPTAFSGDASVTLECTSCHNPHGAAGKAGGSDTGVPIPSYRLLDFTPVGSLGYEAASSVTTTAGTTVYWNLASTAGVTVPDVATKWYTPNNDASLDPSVTALTTRSATTIYSAVMAGIGDYMGRYYAYARPTGIVAGPSYATCGTPTTGSQTACGAATGTAFNNRPAQDVMGFWCATCHDRYLAPGGAATPPALPKGGSRDTDSGDALYHFRHRSQGVNTSTSTVGGKYDASATNPFYPGTGQYTCLSCHNAHGTAAQATSLSTSASYAASSALLKADNRAACIRCHATTVNFFNTSTTPSAFMVYP